MFCWNVIPDKTSANGSCKKLFASIHPPLFLGQALCRFWIYAISACLPDVYDTMAMCPFISRLLLGLNVISVLYIRFEQQYAKCQVLCTHDLCFIKSCLQMTEQTFWRNMMSAELINHYKAQGWIWVSIRVAGLFVDFTLPKVISDHKLWNSKFQMRQVIQW